MDSADAVGGAAGTGLKYFTEMKGIIVRLKPMFLGEAVTEIPAGTEAVWAVLTDFARYPEWATFIRQIEGRAKPGTWLLVAEGPPGRHPYRVRVPIVEATPGVRLAWTPTLPGMPWLPAVMFSGVHEFILSALPGGGTRLTQREHFSGLLSRLAKRNARWVAPGFDTFNAALKRRVLELAEANSSL